jgi:hypothetical protein
MPDGAATSNPDLVTVAAKIPSGVICLISALAFHEITTQIPHEVHLALPRTARTPTLDHPPLRVFRKGRRPSFDAAARPETARALYEDLVRELRAVPLLVATGEFQAMMRVELDNDGPVTILNDSKRHF